MELVEFLLARLAEDEQLAQAAESGPWTADDTLSGYGEFGIKGPRGDLVVSRGFEGDGGVLGRENAEHIAHHHPARVLADVETKRRMVNEAERTLAYEDYGHALAEFMLHQLAAPYDRHPDYRLEWAPDAAD